MTARVPTPDDIARLRRLATHVDGAPLADEDLRFLAGPQDALRVLASGDLVVVGISYREFFLAVRVRAAIEQARIVWRLMRDKVAELRDATRDPRAALFCNLLTGEELHESAPA